ncbi:MAG: ModD protein [Deltaproteobacteria bacterium]|jgi:molybdenum transport protein|nr:ModD protein [Deltaproteobacteria bacterium]
MFNFPLSFVESLLAEDLPLDDVTCRLLGLDDQKGETRALARDSMVVAGVGVATSLFRVAGAEATALVKDGQTLSPGQPILLATGPAEALHAAYKIAQNVLEYAGGVASRARLMVEKAKAVAEVEVLVTRKNFPGAKRLSLAAALAGGAQVHRTGLSDSILIFAEHREFIGGVAGLARLLPALAKKTPEKKIAVEVANLEEAKLVAQAGADIVQCEKFAESDLKATVLEVRAINPKIKIVAAGGVNGDNAAAVAATGVDGLVTTWPFFGKPKDVKMEFKAI